MTLKNPQVKSRLDQKLCHLEAGVKQGPLFDVTFPNSSNSFKVIYRDQTTIEKSNLEPCIFFEGKFNNPCGVMKSKLNQKRPEFVYYISTVIKRSNSINMVFRG